MQLRKNGQKRQLGLTICKPLKLVYHLKWCNRHLILEKHYEINILDLHVVLLELFLESRRQNMHPNLENPE